MFFLLALMGVTGAASYHLYNLMTQRSGEVRRELFQRDLRDLVARFDADERFVLDHNLADLLQERRPLKPLLLPRQYFQGLPPGPAPVLPRQPPRNCFVQLEREDTGALTEDRICAYFAENRAFGRYLYVSITLNEADIVPLKLGDTKMMADALKVSVSANGQSASWWLTYQLPPGYVRSDRFELTAFREVGPGQRDRDRRIEGWAYIQRQAHGSRLYVIARVDFREFMVLEDDQRWPPANWKNTTLSVTRQDAGSALGRHISYNYKRDGVAELSLTGLGAQIFSAHGNLQLERKRAGKKESWPISPPSNWGKRQIPTFYKFRMSGWDLLYPSEPNVQSEPMPDTDLFVTAIHPWTIIEKTFWQIALYLGALLVGCALAIWYFSRSLLKPIGEWSRYSRQLVNLEANTHVALPFADRNNEIGVLATAINALIQRVQDQIVEAQRDREARAEKERRALLEELEGRRQNIKMFGHEFRSPLMSLLARHRDPADRSRRYIERMLAALPHFMGGVSTADAIDARKLTLEELDLAAFLVEVAENAGDAEISNVVYEGDQHGVNVLADVGALEDALTHILNNANRHRLAGTPIRLSLQQDDNVAMVAVSNQGDQIPVEEQEEIFEFGVSTAPKVQEQGQGAGLFVARKYIRKMGGTVGVENTNDGVTFTIVLPLAVTMDE